MESLFLDGIAFSHWLKEHLTRNHKIFTSKMARSDLFSVLVEVRAGQQGQPKNAGLNLSFTDGQVMEEICD